MIAMIMMSLNCNRHHHDDDDREGTDWGAPEGRSESKGSCRPLSGGEAAISKTCRTPLLSLERDKLVSRLGRVLTEPMLGLQLPHAVGVEEMVERYTEELLTSVSKVPLTTGEIG